MSVVIDSRIGCKWIKEEDELLIQEINDNKNYEKIALNHKRSILAIQLRVINEIIYPKYKDNIDIDYDNIALEYNLDKEMFKKNLNNIIIKNTIKKNKEEDKEKNKNIKNTNEIILEKINELNEKLDKIINHFSFQMI